MASAALRKMPPGARLGLLHRLGRFAPWEEGFDFTPPPTAPGERSGPPDFVGIGVQKAGTTWWYELVVSHPEVSTRPGIHKERHFLSRFGTEPFGADDVRAYQAWFPRRPGTLAGEWTPDYIYYPWVAPLLARAAPLAKLLLLVRDPVERFRSGLAHQRRTGGSHTAPAVAEAVARGFYLQGLERFDDWFPSDRILVLQYERCVRQPAAELARTYRFLGLTDDRLPPELAHPVSATTAAKTPLHEDVTRRLVDMYAPDVTALARRLPDLDLSLWPHFAALRTQ